VKHDCSPRPFPGVARLGFGISDSFNLALPIAKAANAAEV
jgi:hypothetical protein